jgi:hypothetical protein
VLGMLFYDIKEEEFPLHPTILDPHSKCCNIKIDIQKLSKGIIKV